MYIGTSTEQKAKNAKNRLNSMFNLFFIPSVSLRSTAPLTIRGAKYILFWRGSDHLSAVLFGNYWFFDVFQMLILPASLNALRVITVSGTINIPIKPKSFKPKYSPISVTIG